MMKDIGRRRFLKTTLASALTLGVTDRTKADALTLEGNGRMRLAQKNKMPRRELGSTGVTLPILQLGTSQPMDPTYDKVMHLCFREGVDAFDTALSYGWGSSHKAIANFIQQIGDRKKIWITSKSHSSSPGGLIDDIDKCLEELKTDYLDLYLMHQAYDTAMLGKSYIRA
jgi:diketogulonate reductase-like aldo/keto reductase